MSGSTSAGSSAAQSAAWRTGLGVLTEATGTDRAGSIRTVAAAVLLDADGKVVLQGLASCAGYYSNSLNALPDHVFAAQQGFYVGWMDTSGSWLYCQSIFSSASADDEPSYGY